MIRARILLLVAVATWLLTGLSGCGSSGPQDPSVYYGRGGVHSNSFPGTYGRGYYRYGRPGRYRY